MTTPSTAVDPTLYCSRLEFEEVKSQLAITQEKLALASIRNVGYTFALMGALLMSDTIFPSTLTIKMIAITSYLLALGSLGYALASPHGTIATLLAAMKEP